MLFRTVIIPVHVSLGSLEGLVVKFTANKLSLYTATHLFLILNHVKQVQDLSEI